MVKRELLLKEVRYIAVKSSGSGGQNVNKVSTKVTLTFNILKSEILSESQKEKLLLSLKNRINKNGVLVLSASDTRSQLTNKKLVTQRFFDLIEESLKSTKTRIPTKIPKAVTKKCLENKRKHSEKKTNRKPPKL